MTMPDQAPQTTHEHDYRPTKAGTYWKVCACGARKHFTSDPQTTQGDEEQFCPLQPSEIARELFVSGVTAQLADDFSTQAESEAHAVRHIEALLSKQREQAQRELLDELVEILPEYSGDDSLQVHLMKAQRGVSSLLKFINAKRATLTRKGQDHEQI